MQLNILATIIYLKKHNYTNVNKYMTINDLGHTCMHLQYSQIRDMLCVATIFFMEIKRKRNNWRIKCYKRSKTKKQQRDGLGGEKGSLKIN